MTERINGELYPINLQLFAEDEDNDTDVDTDVLDDDDGTGIMIADDMDIEDYDIEDTEDASDSEEEPSHEPEKKPTITSKTIGKAVQAERNKWKKRLEKAESARLALEASVQGAGAKNKELTDLFVNSGFSEDDASKINGILSKSNNEVVNIKKEVARNFQKLEIKQLKADPFFADIDEYEDEVIEVANKTGLGIEQAYLAMYGKQKISNSTKDKEREIEQRVLANMKKRKAGSIDSSSDGGTIKSTNTYKLSSDEVMMAKAAGMTPKEYYGMKTFKTVDKMNSFAKKK